jgi:hypothetical protein
MATFLPCGSRARLIFGVSLSKTTRACWSVSVFKTLSVIGMARSKRFGWLGLLMLRGSATRFRPDTESNGRDVLMGTPLPGIFDTMPGADRIAVGEELIVRVEVAIVPGDVQECEIIRVAGVVRHDVVDRINQWRFG